MSSPLVKQGLIYAAWLAVLGAVVLGGSWAGPLLIVAGALLGVGVAVGAVKTFDTKGVGRWLTFLVALLAVLFCLGGLTYLMF